MLMDILISRKMNIILGGPFISPWDVPFLSDDQVDAVLTLEKSREYAAGLTKVEDVFAEWRKQHGGK